MREPKEVVNKMISLVPLWYSEKYEFLEPSCGQGHIADEISKSFKYSTFSLVAYFSQLATGLTKFSIGFPFFTEM